MRKAGAGVKKNIIKNMTKTLLLDFNKKFMFFPFLSSNVYKLFFLIKFLNLHIKRNLYFFKIKNIIKS
jgi:hypothetical protein